MKTRKLYRWLGLLAIMVMFFASAQAQTAFYVRPGATGANNGSDWNNAFNTLPANLVRGATYHLADGSYGQRSFNDSNSGSTLIVIKKATESNHGASTGWQSSFGDGVALWSNIIFQTDDYVFDGVTGGGPGSWESGFGFKIQSGGYNIRFTGYRSNVTVRHVDVQNNGRYSLSSTENCVYGAEGFRDVTFSYVFMHDVSVTHLLTRSTLRTTLEYSKFARNGPVFDTADIHREAWSFSTDSDAVVRYCIFEDISNTAVLAGVNGVGSANNWKIYGNVFVRSGNFNDVSISATVTTKFAAPTFITTDNWEFHHNAIINWSGSGNAGLALGAGTNNIAYNNIWYNNRANTIWLQNVTAAYNWYFGNYRTDGCNPPCNVNNISEANVQIGTGNPFVNWQAGDFRLAQATMGGRHLNSLASVDLLGVLRGSDGVWDRGPFEFVSGQPTIPPIIIPPGVSKPGAPKGLRVLRLN